jgi:hypothetical protein
VAKLATQTVLCGGRFREMTDGGGGCIASVWPASRAVESGRAIYLLFASSCGLPRHKMIPSQTILAGREMQADALMRLLPSHFTNYVLFDPILSF